MHDRTYILHGMNMCYVSSCVSTCSGTWCTGGGHIQNMAIILALVPPAMWPRGPSFGACPVGGGVSLALSLPARVGATAVVRP